MLGWIGTVQYVWICLTLVFFADAPLRKCCFYINRLLWLHHCGISGCNSWYWSISYWNYCWKLLLLCIELLNIFKICSSIIKQKWWVSTSLNHTHFCLFVSCWVIFVQFKIDLESILYYLITAVYFPKVCSIQVCLIYGGP